MQISFRFCVISSMPKFVGHYCRRKNEFVSGLRLVLPSTRKMVKLLIRN